MPAFPAHAASFQGQPTHVDVNMQVDPSHRISRGCTTPPCPLCDKPVMKWSLASMLYDDKLSFIRPSAPVQTLAFFGFVMLPSFRLCWSPYRMARLLILTYLDMLWAADCAGRQNARPGARPHPTLHK